MQDQSEARKWTLKCLEEDQFLLQIFKLAYKVMGFIMPCSLNFILIMACPPVPSLVPSEWLFYILFPTL